MSCGRKERMNPTAEESIAGNKQALQALRELINYPHHYSEQSRILGLKFPRGLLLHGPPGTGKTTLVQEVVRESGAHMTLINPHFVPRTDAGESAKFLRDAFSQAYKHASHGIPSVIFIDEIDLICPRNANRRAHENRIVGQFLTLMDSKDTSQKSLPHIVVVASTNRVDSIDPALRSPGRFDSEIELTVPNSEERLQILKLHSRDLYLDETVDLQCIAASCSGYVGADLRAICEEAERLSLHRSMKRGPDHEVIVCMEDFVSAKLKVGPSITRGVTKKNAEVTWDDVGGLKDLKQELLQAVEWPIKHAAAYTRLGIPPARGLLLYGPPGCSKTTLAKAAAHAIQASFFALSGAEMYSKYVGEGEALLRRTFHMAQLAAPSIIFFDEVDNIASKRTGESDGSHGNSAVGERLLSTLLTEMDGLVLTTGIMVIGATNRPHAVDDALLRPGRFDLVLYVPPPDLDGRHEILRIHTKDMKLGEDVDLLQIASSTENFTGADLKGLCYDAGMAAWREDSSAILVCSRHFKAARSSLRPSLTSSMIDDYNAFSRKVPHSNF